MRRILSTVIAPVIAMAIISACGVAQKAQKAPGAKSGSAAERKVVIGISRNGMPESNKANFTKCINDAGADVFFFPSYPETDSVANVYLDKIDCLIIPGSATRDTTGRKKYDARIIRLAVEREMPLLGICEGHQRINQTLGGVMGKIDKYYPGCTDTHRIYKDGKNVGANMEAHPIFIERNSLLYDIFKEDTLMVNTSHSYCTPVMAGRLRVTANAPDGIIEAYECQYDNGGHIMGLQWHPEYLYGKMGLEKYLKVFTWLADEGKQYRSSHEAAVKSSDFGPGQLVAPGALMAAGAMVHFAAHEEIDLKINNFTSTWRGDNPKTTIDNYVRFVPYAMHLGLGLCGVEAEHDFFERGIEMGWAWGTIGLIGYAAKQHIYSQRPDGSDNRSFPSGHTAVAFAGAELVRMEYGAGWGAGAYAVATGVAALRLYNNEHWLSDILFGAGVGILSAHVGGWLLKPSNYIAKPVLNYLKLDRLNLTVLPSADSFTNTFGTTLAFNF